MKFKFVKILVLLIVLGTALSVHSAIIVDTGHGFCADTGIGSGCGGATLLPDQPMAARFTLTSNTTLTSIEAWMSTLHSLGDTYTVAIYGGDVVPDTTNEFYSQSATIFDSGYGDDFDNQWQGLTGLDWLLTAGDYWFSLEVRDGQTYDGYLPLDPWGPPNPLDNYADYSIYNGGWDNTGSYGYGVRIMGEVSAVPLPATIWLFGSGLLGLLGVAKRAKV